MRTVAERTNSEYEFFQRMGEKFGTDLRVAMPGIVQSFDPIEQTVVVQPAIKERIVDQYGNVSMVKLPLLLDVPVVFFRAAGFVVTMPVQKDDECLVIFGDMCIDAWWSNGGDPVQTQIEKRRHDLSDGFAIVGIWSQPKRLDDYNMYATEIVNVETGNGIAIGKDFINIITNHLGSNGVYPSGWTAPGANKTLKWRMEDGE